MSEPGDTCIGTNPCHCGHVWEDRSERMRLCHSGRCCLNPMDRTVPVADNVYKFMRQPTPEYKITAPRYQPSIAFFDIDGIKVGELKTVDGALTFIGDTDASAKVFFGQVIERNSIRIQELEEQVRRLTNGK